jgi:Trk K+ transport system NAD-binding subunit
MANTNAVAFTVSRDEPTVPIISTASSSDAVDILRLAGSSDVIQLSTMMGQALARRIIGVDARAHIIAEFGELLIAEATAAGTPLVGKTLAESHLRKLTGASVIGIWKRGQYEIATAGSVIDANSILVLSGSAEQLRIYDALFCIYHVSAGAVIIVGGGRVGRAIGRALKAREVDFRIVESNPARIRDPTSYIEGSG